MASRRLVFMITLMVATAAMQASKGDEREELFYTRSRVCNCTGTETANCSNAKLYMVDTVTKCEQSDLLVLDLSKNNLSVLEWGAFKKLVLLQELLLDNSLIRLVHKDTFENLKELKKLDLSSNYIQQFHSKTFRYLEKLQELYLRQNPLKILENKIFSGLKSLTVLDLSSCKLTHISEDNFGHHEKTPLGDIRTTSLNDNTIAWPTNVYIDLGDNPLNCSCALKSLHAFVLHSNQSFQYNNLTCTEPKELRGVSLHALDSADFKCKPHEILYPLRNSTILAMSGQNITLSCRITNDPQFPWLKRWSFNSENVMNSKITPYKSPRFILSSTNKWFNLTIEHVRKSDEGSYKCEVYNGYVKFHSYRRVSLVVFEGLQIHHTDGLSRFSHTPWLIGSIGISIIFLSVVLLVFIALYRRKHVIYKKTTAFKNDFMVSVPFYASSDEILPKRSLPRRPGSEVLPWWIEYPEHLYEEVDTVQSHDLPTAGARTGNLQYDRQHYLRPEGRNGAEVHSYIAVLPTEV